ncbi:MAG TPA: response regulator transcription factor [Rectinemataceae bacterium]|nr:response regulator transcription factor [Rectinemataceae bacterium]
MRALVIDDEARIRRLLVITLGGKGWEVFEAPNGFEGIQTIMSVKPDVVLLDLNLPDMGGAEVLEKIRLWSSVPVVIISVRNSQEDIVALLDAGADDYIVKPFYTDELLARLSAVCRRKVPEVGRKYVRENLKIDLETREVIKAGENVHLTNTEYAVLEILLRYSGKIVTRDKLLREVWGPAGETEEGSLRVHIRALRRKLEEDDEHPELIVTEPGVGYRIAASEAG